jgi:WD40 repeat protein
MKNTNWLFKLAVVLLASLGLKGGIPMDTSKHHTPSSGNVRRLAAGLTFLALTLFMILPQFALAANWKLTASLDTPRVYHTATLLLNGKVLVVGGYGPSGPVDTYLKSCRLYDPATGTWANAADLVVGTIPGRYSHTATLLPNGMVLVAGGRGYPNATLATAEIYNPDTDTWLPVGSLTDARNSQTATYRPSPFNDVLVVGGFGYVPYGGFLASTEHYNQTTTFWGPDANLLTARAYHTTTLLLNGKVLVTGGSGWVNNGHQTLGSAELLTLGTFAYTGSLNTPRETHTATLLPNNGKVLVVGGYNTIGDIGVLSSTELYDPTAATWTPSVSLNYARNNHTATLLPNGNILVAGGTTDGSCELYNQTAGTWVKTAFLKVARSYHTATPLPNGEVLVVGGEDNLGNYLGSAEIYNPVSSPTGALEMLLLD